MRFLNILILLSLQASLMLAEEVQLKYFIFTPECYESLVENLNVSDSQCITFTMSKLLGYGMVAGGAIVKVPQLIKILIDKSVYGISYSSIVLEACTNWITIIYNWYRGNPFSIYGENVFIGIQNLLIMFFFVLYVRNVPKDVEQPSSNAPIKYMTYFLLAGLTMFLTQNPFNWPPIIIESSMILQILFFSMARLAQIWHIYSCKSTGSLAFISCLLVVLGNLGRLFTIFVEISNDHLFAASVILAFILNSTIVIQFFVYWNSKGSKVEKEKKN